MGPPADPWVPLAAVAGDLPCSVAVVVGAQSQRLRKDAKILYCMRTYYTCKRPCPQAIHAVLNLYPITDHK